MKKSDIAVIIFIASLSVGVAYFVADSVLGSPSNETKKVRTIQSISSEVAQPDPTVFNENAINPTVEVEIGGN